MTRSDLFKRHLASGITTVCHAWEIRRTDGLILGFTDHDRDLSFAGTEFTASSGLTATSLQHATGLAVDGGEVMGALSSGMVRAEDLDAGRYDAATLRAWLVNWMQTEQRLLIFKGHLGEVHQAEGQYHAEIRGLTQALNRPLGRTYQRSCSAVLGDGDCRFDLKRGGYAATLVVERIEESRCLFWSQLHDFAAGWFTHGTLKVETGPGTGLTAAIKRDQSVGDGRKIKLWSALPSAIQKGDRVRLIAGCDKRFVTCRTKFANQNNFQGFPDLPDEDWALTHPASGGEHTGGSRR